jgi:hypothetical protein
LRCGAQNAQADAAAIAESLQEISSIQNMNMPLDEDRRSEHRLFIRLPIIVTGEIEGGEVWRESTRTINVSVGGTLINLIHPVQA